MNIHSDRVRVTLMNENQTSNRTIDIVVNQLIISKCVRS